MLMAGRGFLVDGVAAPLTEDAIREAIAGNLCRCTGYTKIVEAIALAAERRPRRDRAGDGRRIPASTAEPARRGGARPRRRRRQLAGSGAGARAVDDPDRAACHLAGVARRGVCGAGRGARRRPRPVAGATDLLVQLTGEIGPAPAACLDLWRLDELRGIAVRPPAEGSATGPIDPGSLVLGALTTFADIRRSAVCRELAPALVEAAATIGAAQIQNRATIGGNVANASPAGDSPAGPAGDGRGHRGRRTARRAIHPCGALLDGVPSDGACPRRTHPPGAPARLPRDVRPGIRKVGTRRAQAISKVVMALAWRDEAGATSLGPRVWREVRLALGSVAPTPVRARATERLLEGSPAEPEVADRAADMLALEIEPIDDVRSTAAYRRAVAARVLHRLMRDAGGW